MLDWQVELNQGEIETAKKHLIDEIKKQPKSADLRSHYIELLCIDSAFEKADEQLMSALKLFPEYLAGVRQIRHLIQAAQHRDDFVSGSASAKFTGMSPDLDKIVLSVNQALQADDADEATSFIEQMETERSKPEFEIDGVKYSDVRDADDRLNGYIELYSSEGNYYLVPLAQVLEIQFLEPTNLLESVIRPVAFDIEGLGEGEGHMPVVYSQSLNGKQKLGSETDWSAKFGEKAYLGHGAKVWLADEEGLVLSQLKHIKRL